MARLRVMDVTIRDGQQSLWATRMPIGDIIPVLPQMDDVGYWAIEAWGGATFDSCLRFLDENPWERLRQIKVLTPKTPLSMLVRGQNLVGYRHYSSDIVERFIAAAHRNGIEVFRVFDALNDIKNIKDCVRAAKLCGAHVEGAICYTTSPVHTLDAYVEYACQLAELGIDTICIKDMAGLLTPYRTERLTRVLHEATGLPVHLHCHYVGGMAPANFIKGAEAGAAIVDAASAPLAFGNSHPAVEMVVAAFKESAYDTGIDLELLFQIANYWEKCRKRGHYRRGVSSLVHMQVYKHQIPGGMMSNLISQLEGQHAMARLTDVVEEIPKVRAEVGFPPLVTPMSQIVGTQAVVNVLTGKRWSVVSKEMRDYLCGYYGAAPAPINAPILKQVFGTDSPKRAAVDEPLTYDQAAAEIGDLARCEEDVLTYALFPTEARAFLSKHPTLDFVKFMNSDDVNSTKEDNYVDMNQIRDLIRAVEESGVAEVVIKEAGQEVCVRRSQSKSASAESESCPSITADVTAGHPSEATEAKGKTAQTKMPVEYPGCFSVKSPMVGTYYVAPSPGADPFVQVGDEVVAGDTLCIVEAMKLMNEITAEQMGVVRAACCSDGEPVEYGQVLFWIDPLVSKGAVPSGATTLSDAATLPDASVLPDEAVSSGGAQPDAGAHSGGAQPDAGAQPTTEKKGR